MAGPGRKLSPMALDFILHSNETDQMGVTEEGESAKDADQMEAPKTDAFAKDAQQVDDVENFDEPKAGPQGAKLAVEEDEIEEFWKPDENSENIGSGAFSTRENEDLRIKENNQDESQNILIAMARGSSAEALYFKGPRERWIRFCLPDGGFLPEKSTFSYGDTAVCFRIIDRDIASKLSFEIFATEEISKVKHELHPENVVHSARLEFSLHIDGKQPRCVLDFDFEKHFTVKATEGQSGVEYEHPCYIDVEFTTIGGVSYGVYHENVSRLNDPAKRVFEHLQLLTSRNNREPKTVKFRVDLDPAKMDHITSFLDALGGLSGYLPNSKAFHPYRGHSGEPRIIFGQQVPRLLVEQDYGSSLVKFRPTDFFHDIDEYVIKFAYGTTIEWRRQYEQVKRLQGVPCGIRITRVGSTIMAHVRPDSNQIKDNLLPTEIRGTEVLLPEYTDVNLTVKVPQVAGPAAEWKVSGFTVADYNENTSPDELNIVLYGGRIGKLLKEESTVNYGGIMKFDINEAPIKRQINALEKLRSGEGGVHRWHDLLLNQENSALKTVDLLEGIEQNVINSALRRLLELRAWTHQQKAAFRSLRLTKAGCSLLEGYPGCGKTTVLAAVAIFLYDCGLNVLLLGASNAAVDALTDQLTALRSVHYVRIRRGEIESRSRASACPRDSDGGAGPTNLENYTNAEKQSALVGFLQSLKDMQSQKGVGVDDYTLPTYIKEKCTESLNAGEKLPLNLAPGAKKYDTVVPDGITDLNKYDIQDAYEVVNNYLSKPKDRRPGPSSPEEDAKWLAKETAFKKCWDAIGELVVQDASIVACTHNLAGTPIVRRNLGANGKKIVIIADEDGQALEPDVLIPLVSLDRPGDVLGTIRGGDRQQLPPLAVTASEVPGYNEFGYQMGRSLFDRLRRSQFPFTLVSEQHRMQPRLSKFPSAFTYYGKMIDNPSVQSISMDTKFSDALLGWFKTRVPDVNFKSGMELIGVNVMDGETVVNDRTRSRSNLANVTIVMELVEFLLRRDVLKGKTSTIITTYADQKKLYIRRMMKLSEKLSIAWEDMVKIATVDSMQGHEADFIILDWVVDSGEKSELGFASDNRRANVALTRARACLIVVANGAILNNDRLSENKPLDVHPEILVHWQSLVNQSLVVDVRAGLMTSDTDDAYNFQETPAPTDDAGFMASTTDDQENIYPGEEEAWNAPWGNDTSAETSTGWENW